MNKTFLAMVPRDFITHVENRFKAGIITENRKNKILKEYNTQIEKDQVIYVHVSEIYELEKYENNSSS
jgi:hypothetical protein